MSGKTIDATLQRLNRQYDIQNEGISDALRRQANGESVEEGEFTRLLEKRVVTQDTMEAMIKFETKTQKTVMNESH